MLFLRKPEAHSVASALGKALVVICGTPRVGMAFYTHGTWSMSSDEAGNLVKGLRGRRPDVCFIKIE
jgi:hypothetical protein